LIYHPPTHTIIFHMFFMSRFSMFCISLLFSWPLIHLTQQLGMHLCSSIFGVYQFRHRVVKKATKILTHVYVNSWQGTGRHYKKNIQLKHMHWFLEIFKDDTRSYSTSISTITSHISICLCRGICLSNTCIGPLHSHGPIN